MAIVALIVFQRVRAARRWMEPLYCFVNPLLYVVILEPGMKPALPGFRAAPWEILEALLDERECLKIGALVAAARQAGNAVDGI
jgi:hypothetical protein